MRGRHSVGQMNEAGEVLLQKKSIHKYTWQHPGSKQWHYIDYLIMRQRQRQMCCDVSVLRSADCTRNTSCHCPPP